MSALKKLGRAFNSTDLSQSPLHETDADVLGAVAFANALGGELLRLEMEGATSPKRAAIILAHKARHARRGLTQGFAIKIAACAMNEYLHPTCPTCGGRGHTYTKLVERFCGRCNGTGTRRYTDSERGRAMGMAKALAPALSKIVDTLIGECSTAARRARGTVGRQLQEG